MHGSHTEQRKKPEACIICRVNSKAANDRLCWLNRLHIQCSIYILLVGRFSRLTQGAKAMPIITIRFREQVSKRVHVHTVCFTRSERGEMEEEVCDDEDTHTLIPTNYY